MTLAVKKVLIVQPKHHKVEVRCSSCKSLLGKFVSGQGEIQCPKSHCKTMNKIDLVSQRQLLTDNSN